MPLAPASWWCWALFVGAKIHVSVDSVNLCHALGTSRTRPRYPGTSRRQVSKYVLDNICVVILTVLVTWDVLFHEEFEREFEGLPEDVQDELLAHGKLLQQFGPQLGRPRADTLNGSRHANMKELRFDAADGVWRVAFAFDPNRKAILLVCGDKTGGSEKRFYRQLIARADARFDAHLARVKKEKGKNKRQKQKQGR